MSGRGLRVAGVGKVRVGDVLCRLRRWVAGVTARER